MTNPQPVALDRPLVCLTVDGGHEGRVGGGGTLVTMASHRMAHRRSHVSVSMAVEMSPLAMTVIPRPPTAPISAAPIGACRRVTPSNARGGGKAGARA